MLKAFGYAQHMVPMWFTAVITLGDFCLYRACDK